MFNVNKMNFSIKYSYVTILGTLILLLTSCNDLEEAVYSDIPSDKFYSNEKEMIMSMGSAYTNLRGSYAQIWGHIGLNTIASDEAIIPYREENLWWDGGVWIDLAKHNFYPALDPVSNPWSMAFEGVTKCNMILKQFEESPIQFDGKDGLIDELKILRAWYLYTALDLYGDIPVVTSFDNADLPSRMPRQEAWDFVVTEITSGVSTLEPYTTATNYGRMTQAAAYATLAKLYLNSDVWFGIPKWQEVIDACDAIIDMNYYILEPNYFDNFKPDNENSRENIWCIIFDRIMTQGWWNAFQMHNFTLHTLSQQTFDMPAFCWDGIAATEAHYNLYDATDIRINSWLEGQQYASDGSPLYYTATRPLVYTPYVHALDDFDDPAGLFDGVRCVKWMYEPGILDNQSMSNDFAIYRYSDILLMKAEALMRQNGGVANTEAVALVNQVRERAYGDNSGNYTVNSLTLEELLKERSRELAWEGWRRQDQIRFGTWLNPWKFKTVSSEHLKLYPVPYWEITANPNLTQNEGYQ